MTIDGFSFGMVTEKFSLSRQGQDLSDQLPRQRVTMFVAQRDIPHPTASRE